MSKNRRLRILLDMPSLKSSEAMRLMAYDDNDLFEFIAIGKSPKDSELRIKKTPDGRISELVIDKTSSKIDPYQSHYGFFYLDRDMKALSKGLDIKLGDLMNLFFLSTLIVKDQDTILVTERKKLLNRRWWDRSFSGIPRYAVLSPREAGIFVDLFCKRHGKYMAAPHYFLGEWLWYWHSMKNKVKDYQLPWSVVVFATKTEIPNKRELMDMISALADRLVDMLTAVDEIGQQYYTGVNNNTQSKIIYHFNYWLTLYVGVLDNLALISQLRYQISFADVEKIGLSKSRNKGFLALVFQKNPRIDNFLTSSSNIINLTFDPRNVVIHRERLKPLVLDNRNEGFYLNMVRISEDFFNRIIALSKDKGHKLSSWGHYKSHNDYYLEPYRFVKETTLVLIDFVNEYLRLLNFKEYLKSHPRIENKIKESHKESTHQNYKKTKSLFEKLSLGY